MTFWKQEIALLIVCTVAVFGCKGTKQQPPGSALPGPTVGVSNFSFSYYVARGGNDLNNGSSSGPWATLQHAADVVQPGSVVHVGPGTYAGVITNISGTPSARIRFISDVKWAAQIRTAGLEQAWQNNASYVDIMGFDVSGDGSFGIANEGSFVRIIGNNVHNMPAPCDSNGGAGIVNANYGASDNDIIGNVVHDIGNPAVKCGTVQGIYQANLRGRIVNNISYRNQGYGIHLWHAPRDVIIANNLVFQNGEGGIIVGAGDAPGGVIASGMVVVNNVIMDHVTPWGGYAIVESGVTNTANFYANNLIWNDPRGIVLQNGLTALNTLSADPQLVNYQPNGSGDYHLRSGSRAINSGTTTAMPGMDFDGAARPFGTRPDMGPYKFGSTPASWPWM